MLFRALECNVPNIDSSQLLFDLHLKHIFLGLYKIQKQFCSYKKLNSDIPNPKT